VRPELVRVGNINDPVWCKWRNSSVIGLFYPALGGGMLVALLRYVLPRSVVAMAIIRVAFPFTYIEEYP
jgi:hypothetical protein